MTHITGSLSSYFRNGCRCDACKQVASSWAKKRRAALTPEQNRARLDRKNELQRHHRALLKGAS